MMMELNVKKLQCLLVFISAMGMMILSFPSYSQSTTFKSDSREINIGKVLQWKVWLDEATEWENDTLYLPDEVDLEEITPKEPSCGWAAIYEKGVSAQLPASVEELFSEGDPAWFYHGVSWFTTAFDVPIGWDLVKSCVYVFGYFTNLVAIVGGSW